MQIKNKYFLMAICFILIIQSLFTTIDFSYANDGDLSVLISGYFEYWRDPTTHRWLFDDDNNIRHQFAGPNNFVYNYSYNFNIPSGYRLKRVVRFQGQNAHPNLKNWTGQTYSDISQYEVENMIIDNANDLVGETNVAHAKVTFHVPHEDDAWRFPKKGITVYRHYIPIVLELEAITNPDKVILKYEDMNGNTLRPDDAATPLAASGYNEIYPNTIKHNWILSQGYTFQSPQPGYHYIYNNNQGTTHTKTFKYNPPPDAYITVTGTANPNPVTLVGGQGTTQNTVRGQVHNLPSGVTVQSMKLFIQNNADSQWIEQNFVSSNLIQQHNFGNFQVTGTTTFPIRAEARLSNGRTIIIEGQIVVQVQTPSLPSGEINAKIHFDAWYSPIYISQKNFNNNIGQEINVFIDASSSTASEGIDKYHFRMKTEKNGWGDSIIWTDWVNQDKIGTMTNGEKIMIYPEDANSNKKIVLEARTGVRDNAGNVQYSSFATQEIEFIIQVEAPETNLYLPEFFYPKQITNFGYKNIIGWDYYSEDNVPYKESIVSLYQLINDEPQLIFENQIMVNRELEVEGLPDEEFRIVTKVVDQLGNVSEPVAEDFVIMNASPIIQVTLDTSKENENLLGINVENLTPSVIESIFPTRYSSWEIVDMNGITLDQGMGKTPEWVDLDERYYGNIATVIQYAENILGNQAQDRASYINNSIIDFVIDPNRLFEQEMTQVIDKTRMITNKKWQIQNIFGGELRELLLNAANQFTQDEGKYNVFLFGDGRYAYQRNLYQYSNNKLDLRSILPITPTNSLVKENYGEKHTYALESAKWDSAIQSGSFTHKGANYKYRRSLMFYTTTEDEVYTTRGVEFISGTPEADLQISGTLKMYKKISLDGRGSVEKTIAKNPELQEKYPIMFSHNKTLFIIEPLTDNEFDPSKNEYILGHGKEVINDKVVFRGKDLQNIRIDKEGLYKVSYKVFNGLKESNFVEEIINVAEERYPTINIEVLSPLVYRNPDNQLKSEIRVVVDYKLAEENPKDEIDFERSKLLVSYDANHDGNFTNDGEHSQQWVMKEDEYLLDYIAVTKDFQEERATFTFEVDNETKNLLGHFNFDFIAYEKPSIPNYIELGPVPDIEVNTFDIEEEKKKAFIDNQKPVIHLKVERENEVEIFFVDTTGNIQEAKEQITAILNQLKSHRIKATVHLMQDEVIIDSFNN